MLRPPVESQYVDMGLPSGTLWAVSNLDIKAEGKFQPTPFSYECSFVSWGNINAKNPISDTEFDYDFGGINAQAPWYDGQVYGSTPGAALTGPIPLSLDVARRELGGPWRMPSRQEFTELLANCSFVEADGETVIPDGQANKLVTVNDVVGIYLKSNNNGNLLFLACCGVGSGINLENRGTYGRYLSSSFISSRYAFGMNFRSIGVNPGTNSDRYYGRAIRPVWNPKELKQ